MLVTRCLLLVLFGYIFYAAFGVIGWWSLPLLWLVCGLIDVSRHRQITPRLLRDYFLGKGLLTWILSPLNVLADLLCVSTPHVLTLDSYPAAHQAEIKAVLADFDRNKDQIEQRIKAQSSAQRTMLFFSWYGQPLDNSTPAFAKPYKYIRTIGVSTFQPHTKTSWHFGPLRLSVRILYNFAPSQTEDAFIETTHVRHLWRDAPLFMFDDTLLHRSVNDTDDTRYCAFIDILRPSYAHRLMSSMMACIAALIKSYRGMFYKNWDML